MVGTVTVDEALCKGCALCIPVCPKGLLRVAHDRLNARGVRPVELHDDAGACTGCTLCATMCPEAAITVYRRPRPARPTTASATTDTRREPHDGA